MLLTATAILKGLGALNLGRKIWQEEPIHPAVVAHYSNQAKNYIGDKMSGDNSVADSGALDTVADAADSFSVFDLLDFI